MFLKDVLKKCEEEGYKITAPALYQSGRKYGFLKDNESSRNLDFDKEKFLIWLNKAKEEVPKGWMTINEIHTALNISLSQAYILCKLPEAKAKAIGSGRGVIYVDPDTIREIIKQREESNKYEWEEK